MAKILIAVWFSLSFLAWLALLVAVVLLGTLAVFTIGRALAYALLRKIKPVGGSDVRGLRPAGFKR
jgi:hypothetical protein